MSTQRVVILGGGLAGGTAAMALRENDLDGDVTIVSAESRPPYHRPPLSKGYLRGEERFEDQLVNPADGYASSGIDLRLGVSARPIDPRAKLVEFEDGEGLTYDGLLVATGGRNRRPPIPGLELEGAVSRAGKRPGPGLAARLLSPKGDGHRVEAAVRVPLLAHRGDELVALLLRDAEPGREAGTEAGEHRPVAGRHE